jgi:ketosteroid isomerase-like protein
VRTFPVTAFLVEGDCTVIYWVFEFITHDGHLFQQDELAFQHWHGDKIVNERFYCDPGQRKFAPVQK